MNASTPSQTGPFMTKEPSKGALKEKRSAATLKPDNPSLLTKSNRTGATESYGTGKAARVAVHSRFMNKKGSMTVRTNNKQTTFNLP